MARYTFLLPAYKGAYLDEMLKSIQNQSFKDFEVIISDDCSPDNIKEICLPYLDDPRFKYRKNAFNIGKKNLVGHWNLLVNQCGTEYLIMASDDDIYNYNFLEEIDKLANRYPEKYIIRARACRINEIGELTAKEPIYEENESPIEFTYNTFGHERIHCIGNYVFKTTELKKIKGFINFPLAWFSDDATILLCNINGTSNTQMTLFKFRSSTINLSNPQKCDKEIAKKKIKATCSFYEWMNKYILNFTKPQSLYEQLLYENLRSRYTNRVIWQINSYYCQVDYGSLRLLSKWMIDNHLLATYRAIFSFYKKWVIQKFSSFSFTK